MKPLAELYNQFSDNNSAPKRKVIQRIMASSLDDKTKKALIDYAEELLPLVPKTLPTYVIDDKKFLVNEDGKYYMKCPECGKPTLPDYEFCPYCGIRLDIDNCLYDLTPEERALRRATRPGLGLRRRNLRRRFRGVPIMFKKVKVKVSNQNQVKSYDEIDADEIIVQDDKVGTVRWSDVQEIIRELDKYV